MEMKEREEEDIEEVITESNYQMLHESESSPINKRGFKESTFIPDSKLNKKEDELDKFKGIDA